jgi:hypothetical protein
VRLKRKRKRVLATDRWSQRPEPYAGDLKDLYSEGVGLLDTAQDHYEQSTAAAKRYRRLALAGSILTVVVAAAAGITVIPDSIDRWVSAALAFLAAILSGLSSVIAPARRYGRATATMVACQGLRQQTDAFLRGLRAGDQQAQARTTFERQLSVLQAAANRILQQRFAIEEPPSAGDAAGV